MATTIDPNPTLDPDELKTAADDARLIESPIPPCSIVIFGATGDLTHRKLIPALFSLETQGLLPDKMKIVGFARRDFSDHSFREELQASLEEFAPDLWKESQDVWHKFARRIVFHRSDFDNSQGFAWLKERLDKFDQSEGTCGNRLYYLATPPSTYTTVIQQLGKAGLVKEGGDKDSAGFTRIIVEKPFGSDLSSARALNTQLKQVFGEEQIYRIDHYLGKETVQNIFVFRFANLLFEPLWNSKYIDNVQVTVAETRAARYGAVARPANAGPGRHGAAEHPECQRHPRRESQGSARHQAGSGRRLQLLRRARPVRSRQDGRQRRAGLPGRAECPQGLGHGLVRRPEA